MIRRILTSSCCTDDPGLSRGVLEEGIAFIQKPFSPVTLARKMREVLDF
jgi:two-component system cell cycle sensor histidine kinase/response regulator CckA